MRVVFKKHPAAEGQSVTEGQSATEGQSVTEESVTEGQTAC